MTKVIFGGKFSMTGGVTMPKENPSLEDTILRCHICRLDTMHRYTGVKEQKDELTFLYECKECGGEYFSNRKF